MWIDNLKQVEDNNILVINYESKIEIEVLNDIVYMSPEFARGYLSNFDTVHYYKSLYAFPGMHSNMSSLYKKTNDDSNF